MRNQQRFFSQPFRKTYRHRRSPRLNYQRENKKRKARKAHSKGNIAFQGLAVRAQDLNISQARPIY